MNNVYVMSANRSAIGGFGGTLKNHCPVDLGTLVAKEAIAVSYTHLTLPTIYSV